MTEALRIYLQQKTAAYIWYCTSIRLFILISALAGNLSRTRGPSKYDDGTGANAHMVKPMFGYQEKNGKWLHFVDSNSCARRLSLYNTLKVTTWCGKLFSF